MPFARCRPSQLLLHPLPPTRPAVAVMLYGFGDDIAPLPETLDLVEDCVLDYATTLMHKVGAGWCQGGREG